jgi:hypothetical protein
MQKFEIRDGQWFIQNVAIEQAVRRRIIDRETFWRNVSCFDKSWT